ncbi:hypothetical protein D3C86_1786120 [compost metagenome]
MALLKICSTFVCHWVATLAMSGVMPAAHRRCSLSSAAISSTVKRQTSGIAASMRRLLSSVPSPIRSIHSPERRR